MESIPYRTLTVEFQKLASSVVLNSHVDVRWEKEMALGNMLRGILTMLIPVTRVHTETFTTPATWWDHFKMDAMPEWMRRFFTEPSLRTRTINVWEYRTDFPKRRGTEAYRLVHATDY